MDSMRPVTEKRSRALAQLQRDAALRRVSRVRRGVLIGAAGLTGAVAAVVSAVAPGRSLGAKSRSAAHVATKATSRPRTKSHATMPPLASAGALGLQGPSEAPQPAPAPSQPSQPSAPQPSAPQPSSPQPSAPQPQAAPTPAPAPPVSGGS